MYSCIVLTGRPQGKLWVKPDLTILLPKRSWMVKTFICRQHVTVGSDICEIV